MSTFYLTFGQRYRREPHPRFGLLPHLPDGWLTISADTEAEAREWLAENIASQYAFIYRDLDDLTPAYYQNGHLGDVKELLAEANERDYWAEVHDDWGDGAPGPNVTEDGWDITPGQPPTRVDL